MMLEKEERHRHHYHQPIVCQTIKETKTTDETKKSCGKPTQENGNARRNAQQTTRETPA